MEIKPGYLYHIKDEFFQFITDKTLMSNKENGNYRPHYYLLKDKADPTLLWVVPISSKVEKYKIIIDKKVKRYGKCNTIIIGCLERDRENAFLIQNMFPVTEKYIHHVHTRAGIPVELHASLKKKIAVAAFEVLALHRKGIHVIFSDIEQIIHVLNEKK